MIRSLLLLLAATLLFLSSAAAGEPEPTTDAAEPAMEFASYSYVVLKKGPKWSAEDTEENRALQAAHLAHFGAMASAGHLLVAGPFSDQEDPSIRGICIYRVPLAEARTHAEADPRVQAGHLIVEVMTWWTEKGAVTFPMATPPG